MVKATVCKTHHDLAMAHSATYAADGQRVYVVCGHNCCPQRLVLPVAWWEAELARREGASAAWERGLPQREETHG